MPQIRRLWQLAPSSPPPIERGFIHQCTDRDGARRAPRARPRHRLYRLRLHRRQSAYRQPLVGSCCCGCGSRRGHKPIVLMGGGTTQIGDPSFKRRGAAAARATPRSPRNMAGIRQRLRQVPRLRRRPDRRDHGQQRRLARRAALHPAAARYRPAFLGQPHADPGQRQPAARTRAAADASSNSTTRSCRPTTLSSWRGGSAARVQIGGSDQWGNIVGGVELGRRVDGRSAVRADDAADDDRVGRQDGQDRAGRGVAQRRSAVALRVLAILAQHRRRRCRPLPAPLHRIAARRDRPARRRCAAARSTRRKRCWRPRRRRCATAATRPRRRRRRRARSSRKAAVGEDLPQIAVAARCAVRARDRRPSNCSTAPASPPRTARRAG